MDLSRKLINASISSKAIMAGTAGVDAPRKRLSCDGCRGSVRPREMRPVPAGAASPHVCVECCRRCECACPRGR